MLSNPENPRRKPSVPHPTSLSSLPQNPFTPIFSFLSPTPTPSQTTQIQRSPLFLDATPNPVSPTTPINDWTLHDVMLGDASYVARDEVAMRAVDGFTGLEESREMRQEAQSDKPVNDEPFNENSKRSLRSISNVEGHQRQCTILQYTWPIQEVPGWFVDLQEPQDIQGILLYTGAHGKCKSDIDPADMYSLLTM